MISRLMFAGWLGVAMVACGEKDEEALDDTDAAETDITEDPLVLGCEEMCSIAVPVTCDDMSSWEEPYCSQLCIGTHDAIGDECHALWVVAVTCALEGDAGLWSCDPDDGDPTTDTTLCQAEYDAFSACEWEE